MNAFTTKPDVSKFMRTAQTDSLRQRAASKRVMTSGAQHIQSRGADFRKAQIKRADGVKKEGKTK